MEDSEAAGADLHLDLAAARGRNELVHALHESIRTGRLPAGTRLPPARFLIGSGYVQAFSRLREAIKNFGGPTIAAEGFGYDLHRDVIRAGGLSVAGVPVDALGAQTSALTGQGVLLTPAY